MIEGWIAMKTDAEQHSKKNSYYQVHVLDPRDGRWYREPERYGELSHATTVVRSLPQYKGKAKIYKVTEEEVEDWK